MADVQKTVQHADQRMQQSVRKVADQPWVEPLARFGYAAKGFVYALIGVLAVQAAAGSGGTTDGTQGAFATIARQPFGRILLALVALGLLGYVVWRFVQAALDTENKGTEAKGLANRVGYAISGVTYATIALAAAQLAFGSSSEGGSGGVTGQIMANPFGRALIAVAGLVVIGVGAYEVYRAYSRSFEKELRLDEMSGDKRRWARRAGQIGLTAHGLVFGLTGLLLVVAAVRSNPEQVRGLDQSLHVLAQQPFGPLLLGAIALGLVAYGVFAIFEARYRRMIAH